MPSRIQFASIRSAQEQVSLRQLRSQNSQLPDGQQSTGTGFASHSPAWIDPAVYSPNRYSHVESSVFLSSLTLPEKMLSPVGWRHLLLAACVLVFAFALHAKVSVYQQGTHIDTSTSSNLWRTGGRQPRRSVDQPRSPSRPSRRPTRNAAVWDCPRSSTHILTVR